MISDVKAGDQGKYQCIAENMVGSKGSAIATLTVHGKHVYMAQSPYNRDWEVVDGSRHNQIYLTQHLPLIMIAR